MGIWRRRAPCPRCGIRQQDVHWSRRRDNTATGADRTMLELLCLVATLVLNVLDAMLTLAGHAAGILWEANPLLAPLVGMPLAFVATKMGLVVVCLGMLWRLRDHRWVLPTGLVLFVIYSGVITLHLQGLLAVCLAVQ